MFEQDTRAIAARQQADEQRELMKVALRTPSSIGWPLHRCADVVVPLRKVVPSPAPTTKPPARPVQQPPLRPAAKQAALTTQKLATSQNRKLATVQPSAGDLFRAAVRAR